MAFAYDDEEVIDVIGALNTLERHKSFFAAPFLNPEEFQPWAQSHSKLINPLSMALHEALNTSANAGTSATLPKYVAALIGPPEDYCAGKPQGLMVGDLQPMLDFLANRPKVVAVILKFQDDPVIGIWEWQQNYSQIVCTCKEICDLLTKAQKRFTSNSKELSLIQQKLEIFQHILSILNQKGNRTTNGKQAYLYYMKNKQIIIQSIGHKKFDNMFEKMLNKFKNIFRYCFSAKYREARKNTHNFEKDFSELANQISKHSGHAAAAA